MPGITKKAKVETVTTTSTTKSPFKNHREFEKEIQAFANKYKTIVINQAKRTSEYFEMCCFNYIVRFYELKGYKVEVQNLIDNKYRYKCSPAGIQSNFSYFSASIEIKGKRHRFEIQHNLAVQSSHDPGVFTTPDISIIKKGKVKYTKEYYDTKKTFSYVDTKDFITFCEVKQFNPFPELLFNFTGILNELKKEYMNDTATDLDPGHIAPSLMISGKSNRQTNAIKESLEKRYCINVIFDLFYSASQTFSKRSISRLRTAGKNPSF